jgi:hypothetical protein
MLRPTISIRRGEPPARPSHSEKRYNGFLWIMTHKAVSISGVPIRVPRERWFHISEEHPEMAGYFHDVLEAISDPYIVYAGRSGECIAVHELEHGRFLVAVYRESDVDDGFLITAFLTSRPQQFKRRTVLWKAKK